MSVETAGLRAQTQEPLIASGARTSDNWVAAGQRVFDEMDLPALRSDD